MQLTGIQRENLLEGIKSILRKLHIVCEQRFIGAMETEALCYSNSLHAIISCARNTLLQFKNDLFIQGCTEEYKSKFERQYYDACQAIDDVSETYLEIEEEAERQKKLQEKIDRDPVDVKRFTVALNLLLTKLQDVENKLVVMEAKLPAMEKKQAEILSLLQRNADHTDDAKLDNLQKKRGMFK